MHQSHRKPATAAKGKDRGRSRFLNSQLRQKFTQEAAALGLTNKEYAELVIRVSKHLRKSLNGNDRVNTKDIVGVVRHPLFPVLFDWVAENAMSSLGSQSAASSGVKARPQPQLPANGYEPAPAHPYPQPARAPRVPQEQPMYPYEFW